MVFIVFGGAALAGLLLALLFKSMVCKTSVVISSASLSGNDFTGTDAFSCCDGGLSHTVASDPLYRIDGGDL